MTKSSLQSLAPPEVVTIHQAKTHLSKLIARVEAGEIIVIARGKKPVGKIVPADAPDREPRKPGRWKGMIHLGPEFFEPLPDDELRAWGEIE
jgi:prevent-host-death family protein